MGIGVHFDYELSVSKTTFEGLSDQARRMVNRFGVRPQKQKVSVVLSGPEIALEYEDSQEIVLRMNPPPSRNLKFVLFMAKNFRI